VKKFAFRLDRVLAWRKTQEQLEEAKLEKLHAEARALEFRRKTLDRERGHAAAAVTRAGTVTGFDLAALDAYRRSAANQASRLAASRLELDGRIAAQLQEVAGRRRDVRLIERLREQKFETWRKEFLREVEREAQETHLAKFNLSNSSDARERGGGAG
jgi:hypothetical protein